MVSSSESPATVWPGESTVDELYAKDAHRARKESGIHGGFKLEGKANGTRGGRECHYIRVETGRIELPVQRDLLDSFHRLTASELAESGLLVSSGLHFAAERLFRGTTSQSFEAVGCCSIVTSHCEVASSKA